MKHRILKLIWILLIAAVTSHFYGEAPALLVIAAAWPLY